MSIVKRKHFKIFYEVQRTSHIKQIIQPTTRQKLSLRLWDKYFLMEIYRNIQTFAFPVLGECNSSASRSSAVQIFFPETCLQENLQSKLTFGRVAGYVFCNFEWVEVRKIGEFSWAKLYDKMSDLFCHFLLALRLSARKS